ncbi:hypothetical protein PHMEG_0002894 [Phytophthora megakarya]|uniref:Uncharacterized protein n=1 Tax=Phytophthora megakarya TaxID=4795 RepID=A0A225WXD8_9STRA|nr:hypothetical protein PHMEG_0002894 [Phytophthora megakarya]
MTKRPRHFRSHWTTQFALAVAERDPETGSPTKAVCLMCRAFERDETEGAKRRKPKTKVHCCTQPWRPDNMRRHLEKQHALRWAQYKELSDEDKRRFFPANVAISTRPRALAQGPVEVATERTESSEPLTIEAVADLNSVVAETVKRAGTFLVDKDIVDDLLRAVEGDDAEFSCFERQEIEVETDDEELELDVDENEARYIVTVNSKLEFDTCVKFVAGGVSFKQAAMLYQGMMGGISGLDEAIGLCTPITERRVMNLCRISCAVNLQRLKDVLKGRSVWAFALALEYVKCAGSPFLDVRVRFEYEGDIRSVHLIGIVINDGEISGESADLVVRYLDVIAPNWKIKLIGISCSNEGGTRVCGGMQGILNRLAIECEAPIFGDCTLAIKLNHLMCEACRTVFTDDFMDTLMTLIHHLQNLQPCGSDTFKCPKLIEGSWKATVIALQWLVANQTHVIEFAHKCPYVGISEPEWWVLAIVVANVADRVNAIMRQLRGGKGLPHDRQQLIDMMNHLSMMTGALGPFLASEYLSISCEDIVIGSFSLNPVAAATFLKAQGNFAKYAVDSLQSDCYEALVDTTSTFILTVLTKLNQIISESNDSGEDNNTSADLVYNSTVYRVPGFLPNVLCKMRHQDFVAAMLQQTVRLEKRFTGVEIEQIEAQHRALRNAYLLEKRVRDEIDGCLDSGSFSEAWREGMIAGMDCRAIRYFCGALAAVIPDLTFRSSDSKFALINWCKIPFSQSITDFSLEAILHAQNYRSLANLQKC